MAGLSMGTSNGSMGPTVIDPKTGIAGYQGSDLNGQATIPVNDWNNYQYLNYTLPTDTTAQQTSGTGLTSQQLANNAALASGKSILNNALSRADTQLGIAQGNIGRQYDSSLLGYDTNKTNQQQAYNQGGVTNQQGLRTNKNTINDQASVGLRGLLRTLGMYGAGGSSTAQYTAPNAVAQQATQQLAGAGQNYATNQQNLDTNWNNFLGQDKQNRTNLNTWKDTQMNSAQAQSQTAKQSILQQLQALTGDQSYLDQANALSGSIDQLGVINPTYTGPVAAYTAPTLSSYEANANTTVQPGQNIENGGMTPYLQMLLGNKRQNNGGIA